MTGFTITFEVAGGPPPDDPYWERQNAYYRSQGIPVFADFPDYESYVRAWRWWRALQRENSLTADEIEAKHSALEWALDPCRMDDITARRRAAR